MRIPTRLKKRKKMASEQVVHYCRPFAGTQAAQSHEFLVYRDGSIEVHTGAGQYTADHSLSEQDRDTLKSLAQAKRTKRHNIIFAKAEDVLDFEEKQIAKGVADFNANQQNNKDINELALRHGLESSALQALVDKIFFYKTFEGIWIDELVDPPHTLHWKVRAQKEQALIDELIPLLLTRIQLFNWEPSTIQGIEAYMENGWLRSLTSHTGTSKISRLY